MKELSVLLVVAECGGYTPCKPQVGHGRVPIPVTGIQFLLVIVFGVVNRGQHWSRTITNLRFADDIDGLAGEEKELAEWSVSTKPPQPTAWRSVQRRPS